MQHTSIDNIKGARKARHRARSANGASKPNGTTDGKSKAATKTKAGKPTTRMIELARSALTAIEQRRVASRRANKARADLEALMLERRMKRFDFEFDEKPAVAAIAKSEKTVINTARLRSLVDAKTFDKIIASASISKTAVAKFVGTEITDQAISTKRGDPTVHVTISK